MHIGQAEVTALKAIRQLGVVEAKQVKEGGVQIMDMDLVAHNVESEVICLSEGQPWFHPTSRHPDRKTARVMSAAVIGGRKAALAPVIGYAARCAPLGLTWAAAWTVARRGRLALKKKEVHFVNIG